MALSAGSALLPTEVFSGVQEEVAGHRQPSIAGLVEKIKERYQEVRAKKIEEVHFRPRGLTIEEFYKNMEKLPHQLSIVLDSKIEKFDDWSVSLIVAGVDATGAHLYQIEDPGTSACYDALGFTCIGSGQPHALTSFISAEYTPAVPFSRALFQTYEAKRRAEHAPGVGQATDMWVIGKSKTEQVPAETLTKLGAIYESKNRWEAEKGKELDHQLSEILDPTEG